jgi:uncharacterized membrane protein
MPLLSSPSSRRETVAYFGALCLLLSTLEYMIPKPIPFMRVGIANLPILLALGSFDAPTVLLLVAVKVLGQGLVSGSLFSYVFLFSAAGSLVAGLVMLAAFRAGGSRISLVGVSILGALGSNLAQVLLAVLLVFGQGGWLIGPPFVALGTASGLLLGLFAQAFQAKSTWLRDFLGGARPDSPGAAPVTAPAAPSARPARKRRDLVGRLAAPRDVFFAGLAMLPAFLFTVHPLVRLAQVILFVCLSLLAGRRFRPLFALTATSGIVAANLLMPSGRVLWSAGPLSVTSGALETGLRKALTFVGLVYLSLFAVRPGIPLPGRFGGLLARVFYYFERLLESEKRLDRRDLLGSLDRYLWSISVPLASAPSLEGSAPSGVAGRTTPRGWWLLAGLVLAPWSALALDLLLR